MLFNLFENSHNHPDLWSKLWKWSGHCFNGGRPWSQQRSDWVKHNWMYLCKIEGICVRAAPHHREVTFRVEFCPTTLLFLHVFSRPFCQLRSLHKPSELLVLLKSITFNYMLITQQQQMCGFVLQWFYYIDLLFDVLLQTAKSNKYFWYIALFHSHPDGHLLVVAHHFKPTHRIGLTARKKYDIVFLSHRREFSEFSLIPVQR